MPDPMTEYFKEEADHANLVSQMAWRMGLVVGTPAGPSPPPALEPDGSLSPGGATANAFCATGEGGGVDPTCSPVGKKSGGLKVKISTKDPATMTAGQINKERAALREHASKFSDAMIAAGRGHETGNDYRVKTDELSLVGAAIDRRMADLRIEVDLRYSPGLYGDLPSKFGPRRKAGQTDNRWQPAGYRPVANKSYFATCRRDKKGHCLPGEGDAASGDAGEDDGKGPGKGTGGASTTKKVKPGFEKQAAEGKPTHEGVSYEEAAHLTPEQARAAIKYKQGLAPIYIHGANVPNKALPDATRPDLDDHERGAVQKYTYLNDVPLNARLRGKADWDKDTPYNETFFQEMHGGMQSAFGKAQVMDKPVEVVRGMFKGKTADDPAVKSFVAKAEQAAANGGNIRMEGYTSTTRPDSLGYKMGLQDATRSIQEPFRGAVALKINAVHGLDMKPHSQLPAEGEFLLNHNSQFRVKKVVRRKDGTVEIHLDQLPPKAHAQQSTALNRRKSDPVSRYNIGGGVNQPAEHRSVPHNPAGGYFMAGKWINLPANNSFCATGPGGGIDPTCGKGGKAGKSTEAPHLAQGAQELATRGKVKFESDDSDGGKSRLVVKKEGTKYVSSHYSQSSGETGFTLSESYHLGSSRKMTADEAIKAAHKNFGTSHRVVTGGL